MSDFVSGFWNVFVVGLTLVSIIGCAVLLWLQSSAKHVPGSTTGHVWDEDLQEFSNPLPNWWRWLFYITIFFSLFYLAMYPGLGTFQGQFNWSSIGQYEGEMKKAEEQYGPIYKKFQSQDIRAVAANSEAKEMGQRLFLTYCSQCHGSDAKGSRGFPNLTDSDWLFGGTPEQIKEPLLKGRDAMIARLLRRLLLQFAHPVGDVARIGHAFKLGLCSFLEAGGFFRGVGHGQNMERVRRK